jgi:hypothetical protein
MHLLRSAFALLTLILLAVVGVAISQRFEDQRKSDIAQSLVTRVMDAEISQIPTIVREINSYRRWADQRLSDQFALAEAGSPEKLRLSLALLPVDEDQIAYLTEALPNADAPSLPVIRDALKPYQKSLMPSLWKLLESDAENAETPERRFNAAAALATYDANSTERWNAVLPFVADQLVESLSRSPRDFASILQSMEPIRTPLAEAVSLIVRDEKRGELRRETALNIVLEYAVDNPQQQTELLVYSEPWQFNKVFDQVAIQKKAVSPSLVSVLREQWTDETAEAEKERIAKRQAKAGVALLRLGQADAVWPLFIETHDQRLRSYLIHWAAPLGVDPQVLVDRLANTSDDSVSRGLLLTLGEYTEKKLPTPQRILLIKELLSTYETHPDSGLHGSAEWLLRKWEDETIAMTVVKEAVAKAASSETESTESNLRDSLLQAGHIKTVQEVIEGLKTNEDDRKSVMKAGRRQWYVTSQGHTFSLVNAGEFQMGSPESESGRIGDRELRHSKKIDRKFAISTHEVTREQFVRFHEENEATIKILNTDQYSLTDDSPQLAVSWYDAAAYCNWLSDKEGIQESQWCYETNAEGKYAEGMNAKADYLQLTGYRLPTEAEWEFACRSGTTTSRYYGLTESLLPYYARYRATGSATLPVGRLKPNGFGLFDMLGNAMEWCNEEMEDSGAIPLETDNSEMRPLADADPRLLHGGSFLNPAPIIRAANRMNFGPHHRYYNLGFRPARTMPE